MHSPEIGLSFPSCVFKHNTAFLWFHSAQSLSRLEHAAEDFFFFIQPNWAS